MGEATHRGQFRRTSRAMTAILRTEHRNIEVPDELSSRSGWLTWRLEQNPNGGKPLKVPYYCDGGRRAGKLGGDRDRARLTSFIQARDAAARSLFENPPSAELQARI